MESKARYIRLASLAMLFILAVSMLISKARASVVQDSQVDDDLLTLTIGEPGSSEAIENIQYKMRAFMHRSIGGRDALAPHIQISLRQSEETQCSATCSCFTPEQYAAYFFTGPRLQLGAAGMAAEQIGTTLRSMNQVLFPFVLTLNGGYCVPAEVEQSYFRILSLAG